jgi:RNA polymerase sigma-70 factor (ECF subfamily)
MTASSSNPSLDLLLASLPEATSAQATTAPGTQESRLIRRAQAGDTAAFRTLVELHEDMIFRVCHQWLALEEDAREACQDTFLKAWQALPAWQPRARLTTWLYKIALNQCRDRARSRNFRQRQATTSFDQLTATPACPLASPDLAAIRRDDMRKLQQGLAALPAAPREILILCAMEGLSHQEAALVLQCSSRAIEGRLHRARQLLLAWWNKAGTS